MVKHLIVLFKFININQWMVIIQEITLKYVLGFKHYFNIRETN